MRRSELFTIKRRRSFRTLFTLSADGLNSRHFSHLKLPLNLQSGIILRFLFTIILSIFIAIRIIDRISGTYSFHNFLLVQNYLF